MTLTLDQIKAYNKVSGTCKVLAVLETKPGDDETATKVLIENPSSSPDDSLVSLGNIHSSSSDLMLIFKSILLTLRDLRECLPPIYFITTDMITIDLKSNKAYLALNPKMFKSEAQKVPSDFNY